MSIRHGLGTYGNAVGTVTPLDHKLDNAGLVMNEPSGAIRAGLFWNNGAAVVTGAANMSYNIAAFQAALTRGATSGAVLIANDGTVNVATTAAPGANSRYDVVYVWQREFSLDGTDSEPVLGVVQGTAAASPTVPSLSAFPGALALATILVPTGTTRTDTGTTFSQVFNYTAASGGILPFFTDAALKAYTPTEGLLAYAADTDITYQYFTGAVTTPGWYHVAGKPIVSTFTYTGIYSAGSPAPRLLSGNGFNSLDGIVSSTTATYVAGTTYTIGSIPSAMAPTSTQVFACVSNISSLVWLVINSTGTVTMVQSLGFTGVLNLSLTNCVWRTKGLL